MIEKSRKPGQMLERLGFSRYYFSMVQEDGNIKPIYICSFVSRCPLEEPKEYLSI